MRARLSRSVKPSLQIVLALTALLLPPGQGLLVPPLALMLRGGLVVAGALLCCALAPLASTLRDSTAAGATDNPGRSDIPSEADRAIEADTAGNADASGTPTEGALQLHGRWRARPGAEPCLQTAHGDVAVTFAEGLWPPSPGTPCRVRARLAGDGALLVVALEVTGPVHGAWLDRWCVAAGERVRRLVGRDQRGLVAALLLGQRQDVPFPVLADCARTGVSHLLALSGLHVALVAATWQRFGPGRSVAATALVLASFVALAGAGAPLRRSALGWALLVAGLRSARRQPALARLGAVALLMEAWQPGLHAELSAQLSFLAVAGLIAAGGLLRPPFAALLAPCGAFLATAPLCAETFGRVAPFGVLATPLLVPLVSVILGTGLVAVLPGALFSALDPVTGPLLDTAARALQALLAWLASVGPAPLSPPPLPLPGWLASLLIVAALAVLARLRRARTPWEDLVP